MRSHGWLAVEDGFAAVAPEPWSWWRRFAAPRPVGPAASKRVSERSERASDGNTGAGGQSRLTLHAHALACGKLHSPAPMTRVSTFVVVADMTRERLNVDGRKEGQRRNGSVQRDDGRDRFSEAMRAGRPTSKKARRGARRVCVCICVLRRREGGAEGRSTRRSGGEGGGGDLCRLTDREATGQGRSSVRNWRVSRGSVVQQQQGCERDREGEGDQNTGLALECRARARAHASIDRPPVSHFVRRSDRQSTRAGGAAAMCRTRARARPRISHPARSLRRRRRHRHAKRSGEARLLRSPHVGWHRLHLHLHLHRHPHPHARTSVCVFHPLRLRLRVRPRLRLSARWLAGRRARGRLDQMGLRIETDCEFALARAFADRVSTSTSATHA